ncbi:ATP-dependent DNA ligase LigA [Haladaptatus salinisoli]|uniref:ATP-dependent DNA ligase LigA n=1 Tax=Haladaptatus salinisoli TaxID=2884876 RepID=UPI001D09F904|nr:ATP-dependent DNA ligase LigA [Haladaptatus salinisoli]
MEFAEFAERAGDIEELSADTDIIEAVTDLLAAANDDLEVLARFVQGRVFPAWDSTTLDIGPNYCYEAIARAAGQNVSADDVEDELAELGDIGAVAASYDFGGQQGLAAFGGGRDDLTVAEVADELEAVARAEGSGSRETKIDILFGLFNRTGSREARYLARLVLSEMRIGVGEGTVRDAIAGAFDAPVESVERALQVSNDYGRVARVARDEGEAGLDAMELEVGRPVQAMLAQAGTVTDALDDWGEAGVEWKFDGARVQLHYDGDDVSIFSRNMEDVTDALPEIVEYAREHLAAPAIVDGEVVAMDGGKPLPFQEILRRFRRKHDVARAREEVSLELRAFDCLHADGDDLLSAPLTERHDRLRGVLSGGVSALTVTDDADAIADIEANSLDAGHEGIMLKNPESTYSPGRRGKNWLKRKPDVETLDLVVTGAEWGEGRRASFLGTFLLSAWTEDGFETIGKVATGITDEELAELTELLEPHIAAQDGQAVDISPKIVFEVGYEEIQRSPTYSSGYALRFPRFLGVRDDKTPEDADSLERVERLAESQ